MGSVLRAISIVGVDGKLVAPCAFLSAMRLLRVAVGVGVSVGGKSGINAGLGASIGGGGPALRQAAVRLWAEAGASPRDSCASVGGKTG